MPRVGRVVSVILALHALGAAQGWTPNALDEHETAMHWAAPAPNSDRGLGGGLTYAIDRDFCNRLLPRVADDLWTGARVLIDCTAVHAAVVRAF
jgi:hypothetical protein